MTNNPITTTSPGSFIAENHWYPKALNATIHPLVSFFMNLTPERIVNRYCHLNPQTDRDRLTEMLTYECKYFLWGGADLMHATTAEGRRRMVVIENNSCPSGQKSMPLLNDNEEEGGYRRLVENTFVPYLKRRSGGGKTDGRVAVIYDKNPMEVNGYAAVIADVLEEDVLLISDYLGADDRNLKLENGYLHALQDGKWVKLRAAFRYLTQRPWTRLPLNCKTKILNPIITCLAGGRNKAVAAKAYDFFNGELAGSGLKIHTPETVKDVTKEEIPLWVQRWGGQAVVKIPYSNAGQGVFTITNARELENFMAQEIDYERYIVQGLIGNYQWSSNTGGSKFYQVGMIPDKKGETYVNDLRLMVSSTPNGIKPLACYSRRARKPLADQLTDGSDSWEMLGTNLSEKLGDNQWSSDVGRLILMDRRDFNKLGVGLDDLIEAYVQTVLSTIAIDRMAIQLFNQKGKFRKRLFRSLNDDPTLLNELLV